MVQMNLTWTNLVPQSSFKGQGYNPGGRYNPDALDSLVLGKESLQSVIETLRGVLRQPFWGCIPSFPARLQLVVVYWLRFLEEAPQGSILVERCVQS